MAVLVRIIGIMITALGISLALRPETMKQWFDFFRRHKNIYLAGAIRLVLAVILLLAARYCQLKGLVLALGILTLIGGIAVFLIPLPKIKALLDWYQKRSANVLRLLALVAVVFGILLLWAA